MLNRLIFDPLYRRFGQADDVRHPEVEQFQREREGWLRRMEVQQRWEQGRRKR